jgi:hypothetical protein
MSDNNGTVPAGEADQGCPSLRRTDSNLSWTPSQGGSQGSAQGSSQAMIYDLFLFTLVPVALEIFWASTVHSWRVFSRVQAMCRCLYVLSVDVLPTSMFACHSGSFQVLRIHSSCVVCLRKFKKKTIFLGLQQEEGHQEGEAGQGEA